jgi:hypothetical protein
LLISIKGEEDSRVLIPVRGTNDKFQDVWEFLHFMSRAIALHEKEKEFADAQ